MGNALRRGELFDSAVFDGDSVNECKQKRHKLELQRICVKIEVDDCKWSVGKGCV